MMRVSYFITATGTDVGKTFTTCALIHAARAKGRSIAAYKPVLSGFDAAQPEASDAGALLEALGLPISALDSIAPWRFSAPLSPHMAAAREGKTMDVDALVAWSKEKVATPNDLTLIEGVGGAMVPLNDHHTVRDWMVALQIPAIVVTGNYLGSISHTLTTLESLQAANIPIKALIVSESADASVPLADTLATYDRFAAQIPLRIAQPRVSSYHYATAMHRLIEHL